MVTTKGNKGFVVFLVVALLISVILGGLIFNNENLAIVKNWVGGNIVLFSVILLLLKFVGLVWPPLPGGLFTFASVPLLGWQTAFAIDLAGNLMGASVAWYLGGRYGETFMARVFPLSMVDKIKKIRINKKHEFEGVFLFSLASGVVMIEIANYALGYLKVNFVKFFVANTASHIIRNAPLFYLFESVVNGGDVTINILIVLFALALLLVFRKRYIHFDE